MRIGSYVDISEAFSPEGFKTLQLGQIHTFNFNAKTGAQEKTSYKITLKIRGGKKVWAKIVDLMTAEEGLKQLGYTDKEIKKLL